MLNFILQFSIKRSGVILGAVLLLIALGIWNATKLPVDAVPDITNVQVVINTEAPGYTPLEVEQRISFPIETALSGTPKMIQTRSVSRYGLSQITAIFEDGTDIYFARQLINEKLSNVKSKIPSNLVPELGPISTGLGEIVMFTVDAEPGAKNADGSEITPMDLRTVHDWIVRPQLLKVPGVVEVNPIGGYKKEIVVEIIPDKLLAYGLSQAQVINAIEMNNENRGVGFIEKNGAQWLMRVPGQQNSLEGLSNIVVSNDSGMNIQVKHVANVTEGKELRTGAATQNGREVVMSTVFMLIGENSLTVAEAVSKQLEVIKPTLPLGVTLTETYNRINLVNKTLDTVKKNLFEGAILVIVILFLLLGNIRAAIITAAVIPIAMLMTVTGMVQTKVSANLMSLGALDFGLLVDGAIIIVENCLRRLSMASIHKKTLDLKERFEIVFSATQEVIRPALFGVFIITAVYFPIFALTGVEGKMFHPMAITVVMALASAMLLSITFVPACVALFFKKPVVIKHNIIMSSAMKAYEPLLNFAIKARWLVLAVAIGLVSFSGYQATKLGSEFVPNLDEGDIAMHALRIPGTSLSQSVDMQKVLEQKVKELPEVERIFAKIGTPDVATDPMPPSVADNFIILKPRDEWPDPTKEKQQVVNELAELVEPIPGNRYEFLQPIQMRFNELLSGVRSELAIKVFGDDFDKLGELGKEIEEAISGVSGIADLQAEKTTGLPILTINPKTEKLFQYGMTTKQLQDQLAIALGGQKAGQFYEGDRSSDIIVRLPEHLRTDVDGLAYLPIQLSNKEIVPLQELASIDLVEGYNQINRENGKRSVVVTANVRGRDLGSFVEDVQTTINQSVDIPSGYWVEYGGTYQKLQSASERLAIVVPITLVMIMALLLWALSSIKDAAIIFTGVPLALTGGVMALHLTGIPFSISAAVGFIALSGIAILNGLVMISFIKDLRKKGAALEDAIINGALGRLRPVITTALVAALGFIPMALNTGIGSEVQRPLATVVIGGIISSTILTLFVLPALYRILHSKNQAV